MITIVEKPYLWRYWIKNKNKKRHNLRGNGLKKKKEEKKNLRKKVDLGNFTLQFSRENDPRIFLGP